MKRDTRKSKKGGLFLTSRRKKNKGISLALWRESHINSISSPAMKYDKRKSKKGGLYLTSKRRKNRGIGLVLWRESHVNSVRQKDVTGLLSDVVNLISIQQTPIAKVYSECSYTFPFTKSTVGTPANCSSSPAVNSTIHGSGQKDVADLLSDVVNLISIQQTPIAKAYSEYNYASPFTKSTVGTPTNCPSLPVVNSSIHGSNSSCVNSEDHPAILPVVSTAAKNIFSKPKVLYTHRSVATQTNIEENQVTRLRPKETIIKGRRIIDFQYFFEELKEVSNHSNALCNLNDMIITNEKKGGISTSYNLKCLVCNFEKEIYSQNPYSSTNLNTDFVSGILSIDCTFMESYVLLAQMHLPLLNKDEFVQECKNAYFPRDKTIRKMLLKSGQTFGNFRKNVRYETQLTAIKKSLYACENVQREHPITTTQQCSTTSDNNNLFEQMHFGNIQREHQLTITPHHPPLSNSSSIQRESQLTAMAHSSYAHQREHELVTMQQCSSTSANNNLFEQMHLGNIQGEHQLTATQHHSSLSDSSIMQRESQLNAMTPSSYAHQREHQLIAMQQCSSPSDNNNLLEQMHLGGLLVEDEFEVEEENEFETIVPDQIMETSSDKLIDGREQAILNMITIKQEINSDDENFNKSIAKKNTNKESGTGNGEQIFSRATLTQANKARASERPMIVNQEEVQVQKKGMDETNKDNNLLNQPEFYDMEIVDEESVTSLYNKLQSESQLKKVTYKKSNNSRDMQEILKTAPSKEINVLQSRFESNRLVTAMSTTANLRNGTATSITTNVGNVPATSSITTGDGGNIFSIPVQHRKTFNKNGAVITTLMPHDITSGIYPGITRIAPGIASAMLQQLASSSNVIPNSSGTMYVPLESTVVQQPTDSSYSMPRDWDNI